MISKKQFLKQLNLIKIKRVIRRKYKGMYVIIIDRHLDYFIRDEITVMPGNNILCTSTKLKKIY